jgi:hypothetical protein
MFGAPRQIVDAPQALVGLRYHSTWLARLVPPESGGPTVVRKILGAVRKVDQI